MASRSKSKLVPRKGTFPSIIRHQFPGDCDPAFLLMLLRQMGLPKGVPAARLAALVQARKTPDACTLQRATEIIELLAPEAGSAVELHDDDGLQTNASPESLLIVLCGWSESRASIAVRETRDVLAHERRLREQKRG